MNIKKVNSIKDPLRASRSVYRLAGDTPVSILVKVSYRMTVDDEEREDNTTRSGTTPTRKADFVSDANSS